VRFLRRVYGIGAHEAFHGIPEWELEVLLAPDPEVDEGT
jgi:hypothetical protein